MYHKFAVTTMLFHMILLLVAAFVCVKGTKVNYIAASFYDKNQGKAVEAYEPLNDPEEISKQEFVSFNQPQKVQNQMITYSVLEKKYCIRLSEADLDVFYKIVEAEAGGEDETGKLLVANVIINRVKSDKFPNTVTEVVYQQEGGVSQFTPVRDGRLDQVSVTEETREIVERALMGEEISEGALYFANRKSADPERMKWFDEHLTFLFRHDGHEFFL